MTAMTMAQVLSSWSLSAMMSCLVGVYDCFFLLSTASTTALLLHSLYISLYQLLLVVDTAMRLLDGRAAMQLVKVGTTREVFKGSHGFSQQHPIHRPCPLRAVVHAALMDT
jgi:hypothetical protein